MARSLSTASFGAALVIVASLVMSVGSSATAEVASPGAGAWPNQQAHAEWLVEEKGTYYLYFAQALRYAHPLVGVKTMAYMDRARCRSTKRRPDFLLCERRTPPTEIPPQDFILDPALSTAELTLVAEGITHRVSWTGQGSGPAPQHSAEWTPEDHILVYAGMHRDASASGTILGTQLDIESQKQGSLITENLTWAHLDDRDFSVGNDGVLRVRAVMPRP